MKQRTARYLAILLNKDALYSSKERKGFIGAKPLPEELKRKENHKQK